MRIYWTPPTSRGRLLATGISPHGAGNVISPLIFFAVPSRFVRSPSDRSTHDRFPRNQILGKPPSLRVHRMTRTRYGTDSQPIIRNSSYETQSVVSGNEWDGRKAIPIIFSGLQSDLSRRAYMARTIRQFLAQLKTIIASSCG